MGRSLLLACTMVLALPHAGAGEPAASAVEIAAASVKPLSEILALARRMVPGKVIDVELEHETDTDDDDENEGARATWVYEIEMLTADNRVVELEFDAITAQLLDIDGAPWPKGVPRVKR